MLTIGEFSTATQLTLKALRLYHEDGILIPEQIDAQTGYRYYGDASFEKAQAVKLLRELGFSLKEMKEIFSSYREDEDLEGFFQRKLKEVDRELARYQAVKQRIRYFLANEKESDMTENYIITEKTLQDTLMCGIRFQGSYPDIGKYYGELFKKAGRVFTGDVVKLRGLRAGFNLLCRLQQIVVRHHRLADLAAPAVDVGRVGAGHAEQRNHAHVRLLAARARHFERGDAHIARRSFRPARRRFPGQLRPGGFGHRRQGSPGCGRDVRMSQGQGWVG